MSAILQPALARFHTARRRGALPEALAPLRAAIEASTRPLVVGTFEALQDGENDLDIVFGHWLHANRQMDAALTYAGYDHRLVVGSGGHSLKHGGALLPDTLRWLWGDASQATWR